MVVFAFVDSVNDALSRTITGTIVRIPPETKQLFFASLVQFEPVLQKNPITLHPAKLTALISCTTIQTTIAPYPARIPAQQIQSSGRSDRSQR